jgi:chorismate mutase
MKKLFALRGAVQAENTETDITKKVTDLYVNMLEKNNLTEADIVSLIFSVTHDLDAKNPCAALRGGSRAQTVSLFAVNEASCQNGLPRCIRAILHCYLEEGAAPVHIYMHGAEVLRPDRAAR